MKELRQLKKEARAADPDAEARAARLASEEALGSFLQLEKMVTDLEARIPDPVPFVASRIANPLVPTDFAKARGRVDVPITIGRRR